MAIKALVSKYFGVNVSTYLRDVFVYAFYGAVDCYGLVRQVLRFLITQCECVGWMSCLSRLVILFFMTGFKGGG